MMLFAIPVSVNANKHFINFKIYPIDEDGFLNSAVRSKFSPTMINKQKFLILDPEDLIHD